MNSGIITIKLDLSKEEDRYEYEHIRKATNYASALEDVGNYIFRPARKHGYSEQEIQDLVTKLDTLAGDAEPGATELIRLLELLFYEILSEHEANPNV